MGGQQAPPHHFVEAHLRVCQALNQQWRFGAGAATNNNRAAAPLQVQNIMQKGDGQQIPTPQAAHQATHDVSSQQEGDQEYSRKRKHEASDPLVGWDLGLQDPIMNPSEAGL